jgi:hypothetical protein
VYDNAFESMVQCGDGAFRVPSVRLRDDVFDQEIAYLHLSMTPSRLFGTGLSIDPTGRDANHCFVDDHPLKEFNKKFPDADNLLSQSDGSIVISVSQAGSTRMSSESPSIGG